MAARRVLTRAERQAQTREEVLEAADQLFSANGYHATSIAAIAAEAGRTIGAVYSNFDSKEALCREVLKKRSATELTKAMARLASAPDALDDRLEAMSSLLSDLPSEDVVLAAEFILSTFRDPDQVAANNEVFERFLDSVRVALEDFLPEGVQTGPGLDEAVRAVAAMGAGLAAAQAAGVIEPAESVTLLTTTVKLWLQKLTHSLTDAAASARGQA